MRPPGVRGRVRLRQVSRDMEPRVHAVQPGRVGDADSAAETEHRYRDGARAACRRGAGGDQQLRHGPVPADPRRDLPAVRRARREVPGPRRGDAGRRRPRAGHRLPHRRRDRPLQRGARVRAAPDHAPGAAPRQEARVRRPLPPPGRGDRGRGVPGGVPGPRPERVVHRHGGVPGGAAIPRDAGRGPADGRGGVLPHVRGPQDLPRRGRLQALRHVRVSGGPHRGPVPGAGGRPRFGGVREGDGKTARPVQGLVERRRGRRAGRPGRRTLPRGDLRRLRRVRAAGIGRPRRGALPPGDAGRLRCRRARKRIW